MSIKQDAATACQRHACGLDAGARKEIEIDACEPRARRHDRAVMKRRRRVVGKRRNQRTPETCCGMSQENVRAFKRIEGAAESDSLRDSVALDALDRATTIRRNAQRRIGNRRRSRIEEHAQIAIDETSQRPAVDDQVHVRERLDQPQQRFFGSVQLRVRTVAKEIHPQAEDGGLEVRFIAAGLFRLERARLEVGEIRFRSLPQIVEMFLSCDCKRMLERYMYGIICALPARTHRPRSDRQRQSSLTPRISVHASIGTEEEQ